MGCRQEPNDRFLARCQAFAKNPLDMKWVDVLDLFSLGETAKGKRYHITFVFPFEQHGGTETLLRLNDATKNLDDEDKDLSDRIIWAMNEVRDERAPGWRPVIGDARAKADLQAPWVRERLIKQQKEFEVDAIAELAKAASFDRSMLGYTRDDKSWLKGYVRSVLEG